MEKLKPVSFTSAGNHPVQLEGILHSVEGEGQWPAAVICHPHPLGGGTMHNRVVWSIAHSLAARGVMALRFNFRGAGRSGGQHDHGEGERADVAGALDWLLAHPGVDPCRVSLVGYSFGAWVGLAHAQTDSRVTAVVSVGLAAWHYDAEFSESNTPPDLGTDAWRLEPDFLQAYTRPKLFVGGDLDAFSPPWVLRRLVDRLPPPKEMHIVMGSDHFFQGYEREVGVLVGEFLGGL